MHLFNTKTITTSQGLYPKNYSLILRGETKYTGVEERVLASSTLILFFSIIISLVENIELFTLHTSLDPPYFGPPDTDSLFQENNFWQSKTDC